MQHLDHIHRYMYDVVWRFIYTQIRKTYEGFGILPTFKTITASFASPFQRYQGSGSNWCEKYHKYLLVHLKFLNIWSNCDIEIVRIFGLKVPGDKNLNVHHHESLSSYYSGSEVNNFILHRFFFLLILRKNSLLMNDFRTWYSE